MKASLKEKTIVSSFILLTSLTGFYYAKCREKDVTPCLMIGGFIGAVLGEAIVHSMKEEKEPKNRRKKLKR
jgi:hypothetical protein